MPLILGSAAGTEESLLNLSKRFARRREVAKPESRLADPGEIAFFGVWFPPLAIPVGPRQVRTSRELPVLIVFSAYSGWISAELITSLQPPDLLAGCWEALIRLGGIPKCFVWDGSWLHAEHENIFNLFETKIAIANKDGHEIINKMYMYLEREFINGEAIFSPGQFNERLMNWLRIENRRPGQATEETPATLAIIDRKAMTALPRRPRSTKWCLRVYVKDKPFVQFDSNDYAVDPAVIGRTVLIVADLSRVEVYFEGRTVATHRRSWSKGTVITTPYR